MPASAPYIPAKQADFDLWFDNFRTLIAATPTAYGLVAGDATVISAAWATWAAAYELASTPATATSANIAAKDAARSSAELVIRPYAQRIRANTAVSTALKVGLGLNIPPATNTPVPAPTVAPELMFVSAGPLSTSFAFKVAGSSGKGKPYGSVGVELRASVGTAVAVDPDAAPVAKLATKSPNVLTWAPAQGGKTATVWGRFYTRSGPGGSCQFGPWSTAMVTTIIASTV